MSPRLVRIALALWFCGIVFFLLFPLVFLVPLSFNESEILSFPPTAWSLRWYRVLFTDASWSNALWLSVKIGVLVTILSVAIGTASSLAIVRHPPARRRAALRAGDCAPDCAWHRDRARHVHAVCASAMAGRA